MASSLLMNCGTKVRVAMGQLSPLNNAPVLFHKNNCKFAVRSMSWSSSNQNENGGTTNMTKDGKPLQRTKSDLTSQTKAHSIKSIPDNEIKKSVFISQSYDIFTNLALEDWFYRNFDFTNHHVLMLWANDPCVVIGRHQNPFLEANISKLQQAGVALARRNSGGGCVHHDRGNMNCTFFTPRERYNRRYNLNILTRALFREWGIKAEISERDDITLNGKKVSGTAAKLGQPNAYHHCTLLVNSNKSHLADALVKDEAEIVSKATASVRSPVKNLVDVNRHVNIPQLLSAIGYEFLRTSATELNDGGRYLMMKQRGFQLINPTEKWFPGIAEIREQFASWDWRFGKTPNFTVQKDVQLKSDDKDHDVQLIVNVDSGLIGDIVLSLPNCESIPVVSTFGGKPYNEENLNNVVSALKGVSTDNVKHAMNSV